MCWRERDRNDCYFMLDNFQVKIEKYLDTRQSFSLMKNPFTIRSRDEWIMEEMWGLTGMKEKRSITNQTLPWFWQLRPRYSHFWPESEQSADLCRVMHRSQAQISFQIAETGQICWHRADDDDGKPGNERGFRTTPSTGREIYFSDQNGSTRP